MSNHADPAPRMEFDDADARGAAVLLFFVRWPQAGRVKTRLAAAVGDEAACAIHRRLAARCFTAARGVPGARVVVCGTGAGPADFSDWLAGADAYWDQPEADLGARLERLFARAFGEGARGVAAIGSDCPTLDSTAISRALGALDDAEVSLLPADDGGYVLVASSRLAPELFRDMPWSTPALMAATLAACRRTQQRVVVGPVFRDIDTVDDWNDFLRTESAATP